MSGVEHKQPNIKEPPLSAPADPAAAAFEMLREEVALVRRAVAGLAAERATIVIPDYSETLGQILRACSATAKHLKMLSETPALHRSTDDWGHEIATAGETARRADRVALSQAGTAFQDAIENLRSALRSTRDAHRQNSWLIATGIAGIVAGAMLWLIVTGLFALAPTKQGSPEQQAAAILDMTEEKAGEHLLQTASPKLWQDLVLGDRIVVANREELQRCLRQAREYRRTAERCVIELPGHIAGP